MKCLRNIFTSKKSDYKRCEIEIKNLTKELKSFGSKRLKSLEIERFRRRYHYIEQHMKNGEITSSKRTALQKNLIELERYAVKLKIIESSDRKRHSISENYDPTTSLTSSEQEYGTFGNNPTEGSSTCPEKTRQTRQDQLSKRNINDFQVEKTSSRRTKTEIEYPQIYSSTDSKNELSSKHVDLYKNEAIKDQNNKKEISGDEYASSRNCNLKNSKNEEIAIEKTLLKFPGNTLDMEGNLSSANYRASIKNVEDSKKHRTGSTIQTVAPSENRVDFPEKVTKSYSGGGYYPTRQRDNEAKKFNENPNILSKEFDKKKLGEKTSISSEILKELQSSNTKNIDKNLEPSNDLENFAKLSLPSNQIPNTECGRKEEKSKDSSNYDVDNLVNQYCNGRWFDQNLGKNCSLEPKTGIGSLEVNVDERNNLIGDNRLTHSVINFFHDYEVDEEKNKQKPKDTMISQDNEFIALYRPVPFHDENGKVTRSNTKNYDFENSSPYSFNDYINKQNYYLAPLPKIERFPERNIDSNNDKSLYNRSLSNSNLFKVRGGGGGQYIPYDSRNIHETTSLPEQQPIEKAEEASPFEIIDVHQYFRDDFDLNSIDNHLDPNTKIGILEDVAKSYESKVFEFSEEKYSLEYFILDEKLMQVIEKLDKIKCQANEEATRNKIRVIEYIKSLHSTLDERARD